MRRPTDIASVKEADAGIPHLHDSRVGFASSLVGGWHRSWHMPLGGLAKISLTVLVLEYQPHKRTNITVLRAKRMN